MKSLVYHWQDQKLVQLTTTIHSITEALNIYEIERVKRSGIKLFNEKDKEKDKINNTIGMCALAHEYNLHMGGSDSNAQVRASYQSKIRARVWPWSLTTCLLLAGCIYNSYYIYKLIHTDEVGKYITHEEFQHQIAMKLLENPAAFGRKRPSAVSILTTNKGFTLPPAHRLVKMSKKGYCIACRTSKERPAKRQALGEIDGNGNKRRFRGSESWYACVGCGGSYCCQKGECFEAIHTL